MRGPKDGSGSVARGLRDEAAEAGPSMQLLQNWRDTKSRLFYCCSNP